MRSPLARRFDHEVARAREWGDEGLVPLPGAGEVERSLVAGAGDEVRPGELVQRRAERLLAVHDTTPGDTAVRVLSLLLAAGVVLAAAGGAQLARLILGDPASGPVNIAWFLVHALGYQTLFLLLSLALLLPAGPARLLHGLGSLGGALAGLAVRIAARLRGAAGSGDGARPMRRALSRLRDLRTLRPALLATSHALWTAFNLGLLAAAALVLSAEHHSFAWQSTLVGDEARAARILRALTLPAAPWPGLPDAEQVRVSRWLPDQRRFALEAPSPRRALELRQAWAAQLLASVAGFGLAPRLLLLAASLAAWRRSRRRLTPDAEDPYVQAVLGRLLSPVTTAASAPSTEDPTEGAGLTAAPHLAEAGPPVLWLAAAWLSAARHAASPVAALWGKEPPGWRSLPRIDSRAAEREAVARVQEEPLAPRGLALLVEYGTTPDAALGRLLAALDAALGPGGRLRVILTGGEHFRRSRLGAHSTGVARRREVWVEALGRCGIPAASVLDFDTEQATDSSRKLLAGTLGASLPGTGQASPARAFERALDLLGRAAPAWDRALERARPADRHRLRLRLAAVARGDVDRAFGRPAEEGGAGRQARAAVRAALGHALRLPERLSETAAGPDPLDIAARSMGDMWSLLARVRDLDPRFVLAGLTAGLLAGPLGGAVAAGTAGLVAGASLSTTLGAIGAALGGLVSVRRRRPPGATRGRAPELPDDSGEAERDGLGLIARTAVIRALVLAHQGRPEPAIAAAIERLATSEEAARSLASVEDVQALLRRARRALELPS